MMVRPAEGAGNDLRPVTQVLLAVPARLPDPRLAVRAESLPVPVPHAAPVESRRPRVVPGAVVESRLPPGHPGVVESRPLRANPGVVESRLLLAGPGAAVESRLPRAHPGVAESPLPLVVPAQERSGRPGPGRLAVPGAGLRCRVLPVVAPSAHLPLVRLVVAVEGPPLRELPEAAVSGLPPRAHRVAATDVRRRRVLRVGEMNGRLRPALPVGLGAGPRPQARIGDPKGITAHVRIRLRIHGLVRDLIHVRIHVRIRGPIRGRMRGLIHVRIRDRTAR